MHNRREHDIFYISSDITNDPIFRRKKLFWLYIYLCSQCFPYSGDLTKGRCRTNIDEILEKSRLYKGNVMRATTLWNEYLCWLFENDFISIFGSLDDFYLTVLKYVKYPKAGVSDG